ncbi:glycosyltransferase family 4 protein [Hymenobacter caeli]
MALKISFLSHKFYPDIGGIESNSEVLALAFTKAGHVVHLLTWTKNVVDEDRPYVIIRNPTTQQLVSNCLWADVVFENNPCLRMSWPNFFIGRPSVIALNTWVTRLDGSIAYQDRLKLWWLKRARRVIAVSRALRNRSWPAATVIENPYQIGQFRLISSVERTKDFVFLGRLVSDKGADQAIKALYQLTRSQDEELFALRKPSLTIIGTGPEAGALAQCVVELGLEEQVHFTGALRGEALAECLNQHRFLLVPSAWEEPFGNVALEGMACGCLPIASDGGGLADAIGPAGLLFQRNDVDALVKCIRHVLKNPELEQALRDKTPGHLAAHHPDLIAQRYLEVLEAAVPTRR